MLLKVHKFHFDKIVGQSAALMDVLGTVSRIAPTNASVLITGESGTGKELIAEAIHANSPRSKEAFVKVNLGGLSQSLFEARCSDIRREHLLMRIWIGPVVLRWQIKEQSFWMKSAIWNYPVR